MREKIVPGEPSAVSGEAPSTSQRPVAAAAFRTLVCLLVLLLTAYPSPLTAVQIQDNSFLLEEAYNQERGVVQHITTFARSDGGDWEFGFTQEWPLGGIRHQLSYTIPVQRDEGFGTGLGDLALNYRYQLAGDPEARTVMAPRLSLLLPTGDEKQGRGAGGVGIQGNFPLTLVLGERFVTHWNAGATVTPSARNGLGETATTTTYNLAASVIWLVRPSFNFLVEMVWDDSRRVVADGQSVREESLALNPGVRWAFDLPGDLQIAPGLAYTIGLGSGPDENALFFYLSFEHPFKRQ